MELNVTAGRAQLQPLLGSFWKLHPLQGSFALGSKFSMLLEIRKPYNSSCFYFLLVMTHMYSAAHRYHCAPGSQQKEVQKHCKDAQIWSFLSCTSQMVIVFSLHLYLAEAAVTCPDKDPELENWNPGHDEENRIEIRNGKKLLLSSSATVHSIHITDGGKTWWWQG